MENANPNPTRPQTLVEAIRYFSDPDNCLSFMKAIRWPDGIICPRCGSADHSFISTRRMWKCKGCKKQFSCKVGTIMEDSPLSLDKWLTAIWMISNAKNGISSWEIHRALGITQKSAWFLLHRIRLAMQTGSFTKLSGEVEVDETFIGGKARNMHKDKRAEKITGRGAAGKAIVVGVLDREEKEIRTKHVADTTRATLQGEVRAHVQPGSAVYTDALPSYVGLAPDYVHEAVDHATEYVRGNVHTNCLENYWSLLKRMLRGTYVSVEPFHLFRYLDEQAYRYNERKHPDNTVKKDGERFLEVTGMIGGKRLTYKKLTGKDDNATELQA
jgi:transposase-like protein